jgi:hypothetical protein
MLLFYILQENIFFYKSFINISTWLYITLQNSRTTLPAASTSTWGKTPLLDIGCTNRDDLFE